MGRKRRTGERGKGNLPWVNTAACCCHSKQVINHSLKLSVLTTAKAGRPLKAVGRLSWNFLESSELAEKCIHVLEFLLCYVSTFACSDVYALHAGLSAQLSYSDMQSQLVCVYMSSSSLLQSCPTGPPADWMVLSDIPHPLLLSLHRTFISYCLFFNLFIFFLVY